MRKLILGLVAATALGAGSAASAQLTIVPPTTVNNPGVGGGSGFNFNVIYGDNAGNQNSPFEELITFNSAQSGFFTFSTESGRVDSTAASTIATDVDFSNIFLTGACPAGTPLTAAPGACSGLPVLATLNNLGTDQLENYGLANLFLNAGTYTLHVAGTRGTAGAFTGSVVMAAGNVPEPATWAMMLLGFGAVGFQMRRRRAPLLAQAA